MNRKKILLLIALAIISLSFIGLLLYFKDKTAKDRERMKPFYEKQEKEKRQHEKESSN